MLKWILLPIGCQAIHINIHTFPRLKMYTTYVHILVAPLLIMLEELAGRQILYAIVKCCRGPQTSWGIVVHESILLPD